MTTNLRTGKGVQDGAPTPRRYRTPGTVGRFYSAALPLTQQLLDAREALPQAANNKPLRCSDPHAFEIRKSMRSGRSAEFERLLTVAACDLRDGVPFALVVAPFRQLLAQVECLAVYSPRRVADVQVPVLVLRETRAQGPADVAQMQVLANPDSVEALEAARRATDEHIARMIECRDGIERKLAVLRVTPQASSTGQGLQVLS